MYTDIRVTYSKCRSWTVRKHIDKIRSLEINRSGTRLTQVMCIYSIVVTHIQVYTYTGTHIHRYTHIQVR